MRGNSRDSAAQSERAYRAWQRAVECGYGRRDHTYSHMREVDARIAWLRARYEQSVRERLNARSNARELVEE